MDKGKAPTGGFSFILFLLSSVEFSYDPGGKAAGKQTAKHQEQLVFDAQAVLGFDPPPQGDSGDARASCPCGHTMKLVLFHGGHRSGDTALVEVVSLYDLLPGAGKPGMDIPGQYGAYLDAKGGYLAVKGGAVGGNGGLGYGIIGLKRDGDGRGH